MLKMSKKIFLPSLSDVMTVKVLNLEVIYKKFK